MIIVAKVMVGSLALLIALAGLWWYAVEIFGSTSAPRPRDAATTPAVRLDPTAAPRSRTLAQRERRRTIRLGVVTLAIAVILALEALNAIRTGRPIHVLNDPALNGYVALGPALYLGVCGVLLLIGRDRQT